jgi:hypothetical protein
MFQQITKYSVHKTNILLRLSDLEIKNKQIREKDKFVQNMQGALEKEQKFKHNCKIGTVIVIRYRQNCKQLDKILITWKNITRIWRTLKWKGILYMQLYKN